ncbi:MAG: hypothetical protein IPK82_41320 [Polyangiaceae bacterium]|nr:hypothetical protein [Polyangiaceae bacterium]
MWSRLFVAAGACVVSCSPASPSGGEPPGGSKPPISAPPVQAAASTQTGVELRLLSVTSQAVGSNLVTFNCEVELENNSGKPLDVVSNFTSPFDGLTLVVLSRDGKELARQNYTFHQSPQAENRQFALNIGRTQAKLTFPIDAQSLNEARGSQVQVQIAGGLPGTAYTSLGTSNTVTVGL